MERLAAGLSYKVALALVLHSLPYLILGLAILIALSKPSSDTVETTYDPFGVGRLHPAYVAVVAVAIGIAQGFLFGLWAIVSSNFAVALSLPCFLRFPVPCCS
jgi:hypothetical protein